MVDESNSDEQTVANSGLKKKKKCFLIAFVSLKMTLFIPMWENENVISYNFICLLIIELIIEECQ